MIEFSKLWCPVYVFFFIQYLCLSCIFHLSIHLRVHRSSLSSKGARWAIMRFTANKPQQIAMQICSSSERRAYGQFKKRRWRPHSFLLPFSSSWFIAKCKRPSDATSGPVSRFPLASRAAEIPFADLTKARTCLWAMCIQSISNACTLRARAFM